MLTKELYETYSIKALEYLDKAGIALTEEERKNVEVAEYELGCLDRIVVHRNDVINSGWVNISVGKSEYWKTKILSFFNSILVFNRVNHDDCSWLLSHVFAF